MGLGPQKSVHLSFCFLICRKTSLHRIPKQLTCRTFGGFPKIRGTLFGVHIIRIVVFWDVY